jgi:hypothetical protein
MFSEDEIACMEATYDESLTVEADGSIRLQIDSSLIMHFSMTSSQLHVKVLGVGAIVVGLQSLMDQSLLEADASEVGVLLLLAEEARGYIEDAVANPPILRRQQSNEGKHLFQASVHPAEESGEAPARASVRVLAAPVLKRQLSDQAKRLLQESMLEPGGAPQVQATFENNLPQDVVISRLDKHRHSGVTEQVHGILKVGQKLHVLTSPGTIWRARVHSKKGPTDAVWEYTVSDDGDGIKSQQFVIGSEHRPRFIPGNTSAGQVRNSKAQYIAAVKELAAIAGICTASGVIDHPDALRILNVLTARESVELGLTSGECSEEAEKEVGHIARVNLRGRFLAALMHRCKAGVFSPAQAKACTHLINGLGSVNQSRDTAAHAYTTEDWVQEARALVAVHGETASCDAEAVGGARLALKVVDSGGSRGSRGSSRDDGDQHRGHEQGQNDEIELNFHIQQHEAFAGLHVHLSIRSEQVGHVAVLRAIVESLLVCTPVSEKGGEVCEILLLGVGEGTICEIVHYAQEQLREQDGGGTSTVRCSAQIELAKNRSWHDFQYETAGLELDQFTIPSIDRVGRACLQRALQRAKDIVVTDIENVLSVPLLRQFHTQLAAIREQCVETVGTGRLPPALSPMLAFHATPDPADIDSIVTAGLLAPGDTMRSTGRLLPIRHGARFGQGIYLSPDISLSESYGFSDCEGSRQILFCMVAMGRPQFVKDDTHRHGAVPLLVYVIGGEHRGKKGYLRGRALYGLKTLEADESYPVMLSFTNKQTPIVGGNLAVASDLQQPPVDGQYFDLFHSRISEDQKQFVAASSAQVLPLFLVTYHRAQQLSRVRNIVHTAPTSSPIDLLPLQQLVSKSKQKYEAKKAASHTNSWVVSITRSRLLEAGFPMPQLLTTRLVIFVDCQAAPSPVVTKAVLPFCSSLMRSMNASTTSVAFHGRERASFHSNIASPSFFSGEPALQAMKQVSRPSANPSTFAPTKGFEVALDSAIEVMVNQHQRTIRERKIEVYDAAYERLFHLTIPTMSRSLTTFIRQLILACVTKAAGIGELKRPIHAASFDNEMSAHMADVMAERGRGELFVAVVVTSKHTDSAGSSKQDRGFDSFLQEQQKYVSGSRLNLVMKVVGLGNQVCFRAALQAKSSLQTVEHYEQRHVYHCTRPVRHFPDVARTLSRDLTSSVTQGHAVSVSCVDAPIGCGFVTDLTRPPVWTLPISLPSRSGDSSSVSLLYRGPVAPRRIRLDYAWNSHVVNCSIPKKPAPYVQRHGAANEVRNRRALAHADEMHLRNVKQQFRQQLDMLALLQAIVSQIKVAAVAQRVTAVNDPAIQKAKELLAAARSVVVDADIISALMQRDPLQRVWAMKQKRRLVADLETVLNDVTDTVRRIQSKEELKGAAVGEWLQHASAMRHGNKLLRRVEKESSISCESVVTELRRLERTLSRTVSSEHTTATCFGLRFQAELSQLFSAVNGMPLSMSDLLYALGGAGVQIGVQRTEASNIDPWLLIVRVVTNNTQCRTADAMCMLDCGLALNDDDGNTAADVLVLLRPDGLLAAQESYFRSQLHACYLATVFTRNPLLYLPTQRSAILVISFVKAAEQLLRQKIFASQSEGGGEDRAEFNIGSAALQIETMLHIMYTFRRFVRGHVAGRWQPLCDKLLGESPHECLLETDEASVSSVCQPLAALCCLDECNFASIPKQQMSRIATALLGEAVSRSCRVFVRAKHAATPHPSSKTDTLPTARRFIRQALGIKLSSCLSPTEATLPDDPALATTAARPGQKLGPHSDKYSVATGKAASWRFFSNTWTNCTPWAIVACMGVSQVLWAWVQEQAMSFEEIMADASARRMLVNQLFGAFDTSQISMQGFAQQHVRNAKPVKLQIAMYVQGLRYYSSKARRGGMLSLDDADAVLRGLAQEERLTVYMDRLRQKCKQAAADAQQAWGTRRLARFQFEQQEFLLTHGGEQLPTVFSILQVEEMNRTRSHNDQLVRTYSGLLRDRCCFPKCPDYLCDLRTAKDRKTGGHLGLNDHLRYLRWPRAGAYLQGMHVQAMSRLHGKRAVQDKASFVSEMAEHFRTNQPKAFNACSSEWCKLFAGLYDQLSR